MRLAHLRRLGTTAHQTRTMSPVMSSMIEVAGMTRDFFHTFARIRQNHSAEVLASHWPSSLPMLQDSALRSMRSARRTANCT